MDYKAIVKEGRGIIEVELDGVAFSVEDYEEFYELMVYQDGNFPQHWSKEEREAAKGKIDELKEEGHFDGLGYLVDELKPLHEIINEELESNPGYRSMVHTRVVGDQVLVTDGTTLLAEMSKSDYFERVFHSKDSKLVEGRTEYNITYGEIKSQSESTGETGTYRLEVTEEDEEALRALGKEELKQGGYSREEIEEIKENRGCGFLSLSVLIGLGAVGLGAYRYGPEIMDMISDLLS